MTFSKGKVTRDLTKLGKTTKKGTRITFVPDDSIFSVIKFEYDILLKRFRELAFLNKGITIYFIDESDEKRENMRFNYEGGSLFFY